MAHVNMRDVCANVDYRVGVPVSPLSLEAHVKALWLEASIIAD